MPYKKEYATMGCYMKVGIVGYGNIGKALYELVKSDDSLQLVRVFSRRRISLAEYVPFDELQSYRGKIDILLLALGSYDDIEKNVRSVVGFDTVDCFDNHAKIASYKKTLNELNGKNLSIVATGWDPGVLSVLRALWDFDKMPVTLWGEGTSQGHSNAIRTIDEVIDGVQFTLPKENAVELIADGETDATKLHKRVCYIACVESAKTQVEKKIKTMPHYFDGYQTEVIFCTPQQVRTLKQNTNHCGKVIASGEDFRCESIVTMQNNATFTAKIMIRYAKIVTKLKNDGYLGAVDVLDIPLKYLTKNYVL